jgi:hypothetical protein
VLAVYPPGAGGKFIFNCLGHSHGAVLQHHRLARLQLDGQLTPAQKHQLLMEKLNNTGDSWNDLDLGDFHLCGEAVYDSNFVEIPETFLWTQELVELSRGDVYFFQMSHNLITLQRQLMVWPNSTVIFFENYDNFFLNARIKYYYHSRKEIVEFWRDVRGSSWPLLPPKTFAEYHQLPEFIRHELETVFNNEISQYLVPKRDPEDLAKINAMKLKVKQQIQTTNPSFVWDCDWFLDSALVVENVMSLYKLLKLNDFNEAWIREFHQSWLNKQQEIHRKNLGLDQ